VISYAIPHDMSETSKISSTFAARMKSWRSKSPVRAVLMLAVPAIQKSREAPRIASGRKQSLTAITAAAGDVLPEVDVILRRHHGKRLSAKPDAFGSIPIESSPAGILELAKQRWTKAILEDQKVAGAF
jgi:hypothetical protein